MLPGPGVLLKFLMAAGTVAAGAVLVYRGVRQRAVAHAIAGAVLLLFTGAWMLHENAVGVDDWSPVGVGRFDVEGRWKAGRSRLDLFPDGYYELTASGEAARRTGISSAVGRWWLRGGILYLRTSDDMHQLRVVVVNGTLHIIEKPRNPDWWTAWRGFTRDPPAKVPGS